MYSIGKVAAMLEIKRHRIDYALDAHELLPDLHKIAGNRIFSDGDVEVLRKHFAGR